MKKMKQVLPWVLLLGAVSVSWAEDFKPPLRGAPDVRIGGGSRAVTMQLAKVNLYAPKSGGATAVESPVLYWNLSKNLTVPVEVKLIAVDSDKPIMSVALSGMGAGLHKLTLGEYGVKLQAGVQYTWQTTIVWDAAQRGKDTTTSTMIQYSTASADVRTLLNKADTPARARQLLDKGFVYDAIAAISAQIEAAPNNASLREERAALLEQIGQTDAAKIERSTK
jgi:hypothetical protein